MFAPTLALAALLSSAPAAASDLLPDSELPPIQSAETMSDIIIWIAETLGPNVPTAGIDAHAEARGAEVDGRIEFELGIQEGVDPLAANAWLLHNSRLPFQRVASGHSLGGSHATYALDIHDACDAGVPGACAAADGYATGEAELVVRLSAAEMATEAMVEYGMAFEKIILTYDDGSGAVEADDDWLNPAI